MRRKRPALLLFSLYFLLFSLHFPREEKVAAYESNQTISLGERRGEVMEKAFDLGGQVKISHFLFAVDEDAGLYQLKYFNQQREKRSLADQLQIQLLGKHEWEKLRFFWNLSSSAQTVKTDDLKRENGLEEACLTLQSNSGLSWRAGKKILSWGKAHAWNPLSFLDSPREPFDPDRPRDGLIILGAEYDRKFFHESDPLQSLTFTPLIFPVQKKVNEKFGQPNHWNLAGKLSLLFWNTEFDFVALKGKSRPERYGLGFSRGTPLEVYGNFWVTPQYEKVFLDKSGQLWKTGYTAFGSLLGLRYEEGWLSWIVEYYRNKAGFTREEMHNYYQYVHDITGGGSDGGSEENQPYVERLTRLTEKYYQRPDLMQEYAHIQINQKNPLQIQYLTWSIAGIWNLQDRSFAVCPQLRYNSTGDLTVGLKGTLWAGDPYTEFGEKVNDWTVEVSLTYAFELSFYYRPYPKEPDDSFGTWR